ncbi:MAG: hypothetical protein RSD32_04890 [Oscillospiraceae bacterium]
MAEGGIAAACIYANGPVRAAGKHFMQVMADGKATRKNCARVSARHKWAFKTVNLGGTAETSVFVLIIRAEAFFAFRRQLWESYDGEFHFKKIKNISKHKIK